MEAFKRYVSDHPDDMRGFEVEKGKAMAVITDDDLLLELDDLFTMAINDAYALLCQRGQEKLSQAGEYVEEEMFEEARAQIREIPAVLKDYEFWLGVYELEKKMEKYQDTRDYVDYYLNRANRLAGMGKSEEAQGTLDAVNLERLEGTPVKRQVEGLIKRLKEQAWDEGLAKELKEQKEMAFGRLEKEIEGYVKGKDFNAAKERLAEKKKDFEDDPEFNERVTALETEVDRGFREWGLEMARKKGEAHLGKNLLFWRLSEGKQGAWKLDDKQEGQLNGDVPTGGGSTIALQDSRWRDYFVKVEVKVVSGDCRMALRASGGPGGLSHFSYRFLGEKGRWVTYVFAALGMRFYQIDLDAGTMKEIKVKKKGEPGGSGAVGFIIEDSGSIRVRNVMYVPVETKGEGD
jgi:hypothetical protein